MHLKRAVIAAQGHRFLDHDGFDVKAIQEAIEKNVHGGRIRHGASTISQQLARNLFLSPRRTYLRKAKEAVITMMIEHVNWPSMKLAAVAVLEYSVIRHPAPRVSRVHSQPEVARAVTDVDAPPSSRADKGT